ncbi:superoxide dismutase family protein [Myxococcus sp. Y35]|uniref:superoxide dismutase family protein n=1 Tax=Pseudomyxococcus flavus TaxID=3115648 RepID=UPI003CEAE58A
MKIRALLTAAALTATLPALAQDAAGTPPPAEKKTPPKGQTAKALLKDAQGKDVGEVTFEQTKNGVLIKGKLSNLPPGQHAFHVHEVGKCEAPGFTTAGGHFNPTKKAHGLLAPKGKHHGDLPNLYVSQDGTVQFDIFSQNGLTVKSMFDKDGSSVMVHAKEDDYHSDPTGDAGGRIACGVVEKS